MDLFHGSAFLLEREEWSSLVQCCSWLTLLTYEQLRDTNSMSQLQRHVCILVHYFSQTCVLLYTSVNILTSPQSRKPSVRWVCLASLSRQVSCEPQTWLVMLSCSMQCLNILSMWSILFIAKHLQNRFQRDVKTSNPSLLIMNGPWWDKIALSALSRHGFKD